MTSVVLRASGYTWKCPECNRENYTGPAPEVVECRSCKGQFDVKDLHHRRAGKVSSYGAEAGKAEALPLFSLNDEIPF